MKKRRSTRRVKVYVQIGKTTYKADKLRKAKRVGWRKSASGKKYFENRRNRSDRSRKRRI